MINIYSHDVPRLAGFYERLGFRETFRTPNEDAPVHVEVELDGFKVGIASVEAAIGDHGLKPQLGGRPVEIVLWSDDTDCEYTRLTAGGAPSLSPPHEFLVGRLRAAWIADPAAVRSSSCSASEPSSETCTWPSGTALLRHSGRPNRKE